MAQHGGVADSYYNGGGGQQPYGNGYQAPQYPPGPDPKYQQAPPNYGQSYQNNGPPAPELGGDGKQTFDQAFKIDKPKYNDLWAGILVC